MSKLYAVLAPIALAAGLALGLLVDAVGPSGRINILAPPLLGLLVWNLAVYLLLVGSHFGVGDTMAGPLRRGLARVLERAGLERAVDPARLTAALHAGAAAFGLGALAAIYLRGIAFEYRAGWETTFLSADAVHRLLVLVLGPASRLTGLPLPTAAELADLQFGQGRGENAARWIHLHAVTVLMFVVLPRTLLAIAAQRAGPRAAPVAAEPSVALPVRVLPYSYRLAPQRLPALAAALEQRIGRRVEMSVDDPLPLGAEDDLDGLLRNPTQALAALFTLSATPEDENHGAFAAALAARASGQPLVVLVDEADFVRRFSGVDGASRRDARRLAWQKVMSERGVTPQFVDLGPGPG